LRGAICPVGRTSTPAGGRRPAGSAPACDNVVATGLVGADGDVGGDVNQNRQKEPKNNTRRANRMHAPTRR